MHAIVRRWTLCVKKWHLSGENEQLISFEPNFISGECGAPRKAHVTWKANDTQPGVMCTGKIFQSSLWQRCVHTHIESNCRQYYLAHARHEWIDRGQGDCIFYHPHKGEKDMTPSANKKWHSDLLKTFVAPRSRLFTCLAIAYDVHGMFPLPSSTRERFFGTSSECTFQVFKILDYTWTTEVFQVESHRCQIKRSHVDTVEWSPKGFDVGWMATLFVAKLRQKAADRMLCSGDPIRRHGQYIMIDDMESYCAKPQ